MGLLDINSLAENVLIPIFATAYDYENLVNLNALSEAHPGIDLGDKVAQVAFQITSDPSSRKVRETLNTFVDHQLYREYKCLIIYIITQKQTSYAGTGWDEIIGGRFKFAKDDNIRDYRDLLRTIRYLPIEKVQRIEAVLEQYLSERQTVPVGELLRRQLNSQLAKEKNSKRYIPDIFVEVAEVKDQARFFVHPSLFFRKALEEVGRLNLSRVNRIFRKLDLPPIELNWQHDSAIEAITIGRLHEGMGPLMEALSDLRDRLYPYSFSFRSSSIPDIPAIPTHKRYMYEDMKYSLQPAASRAVWDIEAVLKYLEFISSRILFIVGRAGQGKTNFVCDLAETVLTKRGIPCAYFTGREFNHIAPERIHEYFVRSIFGDRVSSLDDALALLTDFAVQSNAPVVVIIDGINEHRSIQDFSHYLERFVEKVLEYEHIRFILTCRAEYFEERFTNFKQASFAQQIRFIDNLERHMSEVHKERLVDGYFRFFNLRYPYMSKHAAEILENDTLLLRLFCETYGNIDAHEAIQLPDIIDIYRDKIFREYLERKIHGAAEYEDSSRLRVGTKDKYRQVLGYIIQLMVQQQRYSDITITDIPAEYYEPLGELLGEDVIVRKDLANVDNVLDNRVEVINFTFDEFRDFLLANYLVTSVFRQNPQQFEEIVDRMAAPNSLTAEGIRTYLFFASRRPNGRAILEAIAKKDWYKEIFVKSIFSVEEDFITQDDLDEIKTRFYEDERTASWILRMLVWRWRSGWYPKLNIHLLFEILNELDENTFNSLVRPSVTGWGVYGFDGTRSWRIGELARELDEELGSESLSEMPDFMNLVQLLVYFFPIWDVETSIWAAFETFAKFAESKPDLAVSMLRKHTRIAHLGTRTQVWRMLTYIAKSESTTTDLVDEACGLLLETGQRVEQRTELLAKEIVRFLEVCAQEKKLWYRDDVVEQMKRYTLFPYFYEQIDDTRT